MGSFIYAGSRFNLTTDGTGDRRPATSELKREVRAWHGQLKLTFFDDLDLIGGLRIEDLRITSENDPFEGRCGSELFVDGECPPPPPGGVPQGPTLFPSRFFFFDRADNRFG